jgi:hypothetical protein
MCEEGTTMEKPFIEEIPGPLKDLSPLVRSKLATDIRPYGSRYGTLMFTSARMSPPDKWLLCTVCVRDCVEDRGRWTSLACNTCWKVDREAAALLGAHMTLPLGRHSLMNRVGIRLTSSRGERVAGYDQLVGMVRAWETLDHWRKREVGRLKLEAGLRGESVSWDSWAKIYPHSREECEMAHARLITTRFPSWFGLTQAFDDYIAGQLPYQGPD